jgi:hypothetical protein
MLDSLLFGRQLSRLGDKWREVSKTIGERAASMGRSDLLGPLLLHCAAFIRKIPSADWLVEARLPTLCIQSREAYRIRITVLRVMRVPHEAICTNCKYTLQLTTAYAVR